MDVYQRLSHLFLCLTLAIASPAFCFSDEPIIEQQKVGDRVHDFELPIVGSNDYLRLSEQYRRGPIVLVVLRGYPGYQCQLCTRQVASLTNRARAIEKLAEKIILVYPGSSDSLERHAERFVGVRRRPDSMIMVRDDRMETVRQWGLRWDERYETAYPATYIIDRNGRIRWKKVSTSHAGRSTVEEILKQLRKL